MTGREWKPGDVALVQNEHGVWNRAIRQVRPVGDAWVYGVASTTSPIDAPVRPLVVIDPEDRDQVERLTSLIYAQVGDDLAPNVELPDALPDTYSANGVKAALREFANPTPPKPDEPAGLGAVVEDADGRRWIAHEPDGGRVGTDRWRWYPAGYVSDSVRRCWSDIDAALVISEGVWSE